MNCCKQFVPSILLIGSVVAISIFVALMSRRYGRSRLQSAALDDWEADGGSVAMPASSIDPEAGRPAS